MNDKLSPEKLAEATAQAKALQQQGVTPDGPTPPAKTAEGGGNSSTQNHREVIQDKPVPYEPSPGSIPNLRSKGKDKGMSL